MTKTFAVLSGLALVAHAALVHSPSMGTANTRALLAVVFIFCLVRALPAFFEDFLEA